MNNPNFYAQAEANQGKFRHHPPTAAVIRPLQTIEGTEQSIRVDANQTLRGPHRRSQQLNDYVSWLQQQSVEQINQADQIAGYEQEQAQLQAQQQRQPQQGTSSDAKTGGWTFSSASKMVFGTKSDLDIPTSDAPGNRRDATQMEKPPRKQPPKSKPIIEFVTSRRIEKTIDRLDSPHATSGSGRVPAPKMAASDYPVADIQVDADLGRILQKLETNEQNPVVSPVENDLSNDWLSDSSTNHSSARTSVPDEPVPTVADHPTSNVRDFFSPPPGRKKIFPAEFMHVDSVIDDQMNHTLSNQTATENLSKQEIIETVSKAIAAVLTDQNESVIERKVRERFEELQRELKIQTETSLAQPSGLESPRPIETKQVMNPKNEPSAVPTPAVDTTKFAKTLDAPPVQTNLPKSGSSKVPVEIAAWDVNDFRWPTISTQMITVGSKAIEALYRSLEPSSR